MVNTLRQRQNGQHFADGIYKSFFMTNSTWISINISLKFVPKGQINYITALVQIMAWHGPGDKPLSEPMMAWFTDAYMRHNDKVCRTFWYTLHSVGRCKQNAVLINEHRIATNFARATTQLSCHSQEIPVNCILVAITWLKVGRERAKRNVHQIWIGLQNR